MNNLVVLPIFIPVLTGILLILFMKSVRIQRWISGIGTVIALGIAILLFAQVSVSGLQLLNMGGWAAPYGIVFVADTLASLLVLVASIIAVACIFYAFRSLTEEREIPLLRVLSISDGWRQRLLPNRRSVQSIRLL